MTVGVLALQGAFIEHEKMLARLGADSFEIRQKSDLDRSFDRLIIPGGESTVMGKLLRELDMMDDIRKLITDGMPVFGTCAGLILLAERIENDPAVHLGTMSIEACRNAYGRQLGSFFTEDKFNGKTIPMTFIRAPYISKAADSVEILSVTDGRITAAREKNMLATAFHPELNSDTSVHEYFLNM
ncbi:MAG: pyridoxal 5'-phosphate synthase glutaminase subunit PdxT [Oscillospiraceae bacterium]|nr:pyridoxal 5'-phosphate synthase glutaminase subunit PdxT [Oscillospiraceae bacterium]MDY2847152.1 pyridoxal 5'-phosphate synthase glutaminase subunit PdxT [Oscillospiraceae bacterium]